MRLILIGRYCKRTKACQDRSLQKLFTRIITMMVTAKMIMMLIVTRTVLMIIKIIRKTLIP